MSESEFSEPIKWERVPVEGTDLGYEVYRHKLDGKGWLVIMMPVGMVMDEQVWPVAPTFIPDEANMWGK